MLITAPPPLASFADRLAARVPLDEREREALLDLPASTAFLAANRQIVAEAEVPNHAYLVIDGLLGRVQHTRRGDQQITALYLPGESACFEGVLRAEPSPAIQALASTTLLVIPYVALRRAQRRHPALGGAYWGECLRHATIASDWLLNIGRRRSLARTAHLFCELACRHGSSGGRPRSRFALPARQSQLADMLALTPVHLNRTLRVLREEGLVSFEDRDLCIHDWQRLAKLGDFHPGYLG